MSWSDWAVKCSQNATPVATHSAVKYDTLQSSLFVLTGMNRAHAPAEVTGDPGPELDPRTGRLPATEVMAWKLHPRTLAPAQNRRSHPFCVPANGATIVMPENVGLTLANPPEPRLLLSLGPPNTLNAPVPPEGV
jgi:hypothetical protein